MAKRKLFISGPMSDRPLLNFLTFFRIENELKEKYTVINPARLSISLWINRGIIKKQCQWPECLDNLNEIEKQYKLSYKDYIRNDLSNLLCCDILYQLPDWEYSKGANIEFMIAKFLHMDIITRGV